MSATPTVSGEKKKSEANFACALSEFQKKLMSMPGAGQSINDKDAAKIDAELAGLASK